MFAVSYARWSSMEQGAGSTLERQLQATGDHIAAMGWETLREPLIDRGKSAYTGDNIETGNLGKFAAKIISGELDASKIVLVVEELDRLSRQPADVMLTWLSPLVRKGLSIKVVSSGQLINRAMLDSDMGGLMMILITAFGSHTESKKKAKRVAAAWEKKREDAREGKAVNRSHRRPKWVEVDADGQFFVPDHKRKIVEMVFENRIAGIGKGLTAKRLNELALVDDNYAPWALRNGGSLPKMWTATYVGRILQNRAVMGEWQPFYRPRKGEACPAGEPITDYYPRIITPADFTRANDARIKEALKRQGRGKNLSNLLGTRTKCAACGGQMIAKGSSRFRVNKKGETHRHYFLYCQNAKVANTCDNQQGWTYDRVETPILDRLLTLAMDDQHFGGGLDVALFERSVFEARASVADLQSKITLLLDALEVGGNAIKDRLAQRNRELEAAKDRLAASEEALAEARGKVSPAEHLRRVAEVRQLMWSDDEAERFQARSRIKQALGDLIYAITFYPKNGNVRVMLVDRLRMFTISHAGEVFEDFNPLGGAPGYGKVEVSTGGKVVEVINDLSPDQQLASEAYARRNKIITQ